MNILVVNAGSSSIKYRLYAMPGAGLLESGLVERIGESESRWMHRVGESEQVRQEPVPDHHHAMQQIFAALAASKVEAVGHRVVHGGETFHQPVLIDAGVVEGIRRTIPLAPVHNPGSLACIELALRLCPQVPQVAVFDTAFHQTMPPHAFRYALPETLYREHQVRRYGFHGTSHHYVAREAARFLERPLKALNLITLHLGNGASATAIRAGRSVDTSMGLTPLEGLLMGTRSGDLDPAIPFYLARRAGLGWEQIEALLNQQSGLKGLCGENDLRLVQRLAAAGDERARLAIDMYCYRIRKYIGAYYAVLGRVDALVFTAGVGENDAQVRAASCAGLEGLGIAIDPERNQGGSGDAFAIHSPESRVHVLVVPTNEELAIAAQTLARIRAARS